MNHQYLCQLFLIPVVQLSKNTYGSSMPTVLAILFAQIVALLIEFIGVKQPGKPAGAVSVQKDLEVADP